MCSIHTTATPVSRRSRIVATNASTSASVRPPAISSRSNSRGSVASARASSRRLRSSSVSAPAGSVGATQHADPLERLDGGRLDDARGGRPPRPPRSERRADEHVLEDGETLERTRDLRGASDAHVAADVCRTTRHVDAVERHRAGVGPQVAGDQVEQRRLAGAVGPDDPDRVTLGDLERQTVDDREAAEPFGQ